MKVLMQYACGCQIRQIGDNPDLFCRIEYCPKHDAAPDMHEALKTLLRDYSINPNSNIFYEACRKARQALAKAEGKEAK